MTGFGKDRFREDQVQRLDNNNRDAEYVVVMRCSVGVEVRKYKSREGQHGCPELSLTFR